MVILIKIVFSSINRCNFYDALQPEISARPIKLLSKTVIAAIKIITLIDNLSFLFFILFDYNITKLGSRRLLKLCREYFKPVNYSLIMFDRDNNKSTNK